MLTRQVWLIVLGLSGAALFWGVHTCPGGWCQGLNAPTNRAIAAPPPTPAGGQPTPTFAFDRLAAPPTQTNPSQADTGAQLYWQHCQPCHGDRAQGLTDEWRSQYPPEEQNCWKSGCHGDRPYQNGFTLPPTVPALVGPGTLSKFATAADLYTFMSHAMPFQAPGHLKPAEYWAITAFVLRGHGLPQADLPITDLTIAAHIPLGAPSTAAAANGTPSTAQPPAAGAWRWLALGAAAALAAGAMLWRVRRGNRHG